MATRTIRADKVTDLDHVFTSYQRFSVARVYEAQGIVVIHAANGDVYNYLPDDPVCVLRP